MIAKKITPEEIDFEKDEIMSFNEYGEYFEVDSKDAKEFKYNLWKVFFQTHIGDDDYKVSIQDLDLPNEEGLKLISGMRQC
jgi:hypothetical protein